MTAPSPLAAPFPDRPMAAPAGSVALLGAGFPDLRIRAEAETGAIVAVGQVVFRDARHPSIAFVSPIHGRVAAIEHGPRRVLSAFIIEPVAGQQVAAPVRSGDSVRAQMLDRGLWPALVARPFGGPPDPEASPDAIVVLAAPTSPTAPDPATVLAKVLADRADDFDVGLIALTELTEGPVHLCVGKQWPRAVQDHPRLRVHRRRFGRRWQAKAAQVARAVGRGGASGRVWTIGYQDVAALGHLLRTGACDPLRTIAVSRPGGAQPETLRVPLGSSLGPLFGPVTGSPARLRSTTGPSSERRWSLFLGRHDVEASLVPDLGPPPTGAPLRPLIPFNALDRPLPFGVPTVPLMRALTTGDRDACARLGCLSLLPEDVAHLTDLCASGTDYGRRLAEILGQLRKDLST